MDIHLQGRHRGRRQSIDYWWPQVPVWVTALVALIVLLGANPDIGRLFGRAEFWFSAITVTAIVGMIVVGIAGAGLRGRGVQTTSHDHAHP